MTNPDESRELQRIEGKLLELLNEVYQFRTRNGDGSKASGWVPLKEAARIIGKSERATWTRAQRLAGCAWFDGGRRFVNLHRIQVLVRPPSSPTG